MTTTTETAIDFDFDSFFGFAEAEEIADEFFGDDTDDTIECPYPEGSPEWEDFWVEQGA